MEKSKTSFGVREITITAILLAICIVSQIFKSLSVFITGPIINLCLALAVTLVNLPCAITLSIITPITAFFISSSPVMMAVPAILIFIMGGNIVLVLAVHFLLKKDVLEAKGAFSPLCYIKAAVCALLKGLFMGLTISLWLLPTFIPAENPLQAKMSIFQTTFSVVQFATACIGFVYYFIIIVILKKYMKKVGS